MPKEVPKEDPKITIISDGHADNTRVVFDGKILPAVKSIMFYRVEPGKPIMVSVEFADVRLDLKNVSAKGLKDYVR